MSKYGVISALYFPVFRPNTGKYGPEITVFGLFSRSILFTYQLLDVLSDIATMDINLATELSKVNFKKKLDFVIKLNNIYRDFKLWKASMLVQ